MPVNKVPVATIAQYTETVLPGNELRITGRFGATELSQTIPTSGETGVICFNPENLNFYFLPLIGMEPQWELVSVIRSITSGLQA